MLARTSSNSLNCSELGIFLSLLHNGSVNTFSRQREVVAIVVFRASVSYQKKPGD
jgi:hypothetical protein